VLVATNPFFMLGAAVALGYERASVRKVVGLMVGFVGVFVMVGAGLSGGRTLVVAMLQVLFAAAVLWPTYTVLMRRAGDSGWKPLQIAARFILWTAVFLVIGAALIEGKPLVTLSRPAVGALIYLAFVGTVIAWSLYTYFAQSAVDDGAVHDDLHPACRSACDRLGTWRARVGPRDAGRGRTDSRGRGPRCTWEASGAAANGDAGRGVGRLHHRFTHGLRQAARRWKPCSRNPGNRARHRCRTRKESPGGLPGEHDGVSRPRCWARAPGSERTRRC
jgi:uncharacterized membrane protein YhaH (DUF805 family)